MGKIIKEFETQYEVGDVVIFHKGGLHVGIVEGYYIEDNIFWFNIRVSPTLVYTYTNHGDVGEHDIIGKINGDLEKQCNDKICANKR